MKTYAQILVILCFFNGISQDLNWAKNIGGLGSDNSAVIATDTSGNFYITGTFSGNAGNFDIDPGPATHTISFSGGQDVYVTKHNASGSLVWARSFGGPGPDWGSQVTTDIQGNVYVMGQFSGVSDFDPGSGTYTMSAGNGVKFFVCKLSPQGHFIWAKIVVDHSGTHMVTSMATDTAGNCFFSGHFSNTADFDSGTGTMTITAQGPNDAFVLKLDKNGNYEWVKIISGSGSDAAFFITLDEFQNIYVTGSFSGTVDIDPGPGTSTLAAVGGGDAFILKLDPSGNLVFGKSLGGEGNDIAQCIQVQPGGGIVISGTFSGTANFSPAIGSFTDSSFIGSRQHYIVKLDAGGNYSWAKAIGFVPQFTGKNISVSSAGSVLLTGSFSNTVDFDPGPASYTMNFTPTSTQQRTAFLLQLDAAGQFVWARDFGALQGRSVAFTSTNTAIVIGEFRNTVDFDLTTAINNITSSGDVDVFIMNITSTVAVVITDGIEYRIADPGTVVYPNPVSHSLRLLGPGASGQTYTLIDVNGKVHMQGNTDPEEDIDVHSLPSGLYFLNINGTHKSTHKFMKK